MSDKMRIIPFEEMLNKLLKEYKERKTLYGVTVDRSHSDIPVGPAAGPHTQLAGNIVAAYAAGASYIELKTVQVLEGDELNLSKPGIYARQAVFNIEWSAELKVMENLNEFIKAYILIHILGKELQLDNPIDVNFVMSVGYDLAGIRSEKIDYFLEHMKHASDTEEWKQDIQFLMKHLNWFEHIKSSDIKELNDCISNTVTLSTMHGCKSSEIEKIATYLIKEKKLNTWIKMNPTLIGIEKTKAILQAKGYGDFTFDPDIFAKDITLDMAAEIIKNMQACASRYGKTFGVKLTNTFPILIQKEELAGREMYMSGPPLFAISINAAAILAEKTGGSVPISYSGGADVENIHGILETGIQSVSVSSILLKPGGYRNLTRLQKAADGYTTKKTLDIDILKEFANQAVNDVKYNKKESKQFERAEKYSDFCAKCNNCSDVCPNRANIRLETEDSKYVIHRDRLCNECGNCACFCILGHVPYLEKFTLFENEEDFYDSRNDGMLYTEKKQICRRHGLEGYAPDELVKLIQTAYEKGRI